MKTNLFLVAFCALFIGLSLCDTAFGQFRYLGQSRVVQGGFDGMWMQEAYVNNYGTVEWLEVRVYDEATRRWGWIIEDGGRHERLIPPPRQIQSSRNSTNVRTTAANTSRGYRLERGDVILEINGERIGRQEDVTSAIARSPQTMYLTVRDGRTGTVAHFVTTLSSSRPRFGMTHQTNPGGGSRVTGVNQNAPRIYLVE